VTGGMPASRSRAGMWGRGRPHLRHARPAARREHGTRRHGDSRVAMDARATCRPTCGVTACHPATLPRVARPQGGYVATGRIAFRSRLRVDWLVAGGTTTVRHAECESSCACGTRAIRIESLSGLSSGSAHQPDPHCATVPGTNSRSDLLSTCLLPACWIERPSERAQLVAHYRADSQVLPILGA
jgi:hypothetical protein